MTRTIPPVLRMSNLRIKTVEPPARVDSGTTRNTSPGRSGSHTCSDGPHQASPTHLPSLTTFSLYLMASKGGSRCNPGPFPPSTEHFTTIQLMHGVCYRSLSELSPPDPASHPLCWDRGNSITWQVLQVRRTDAEAEAPILWPPDVKSQLIGKDPDAGKE